VQRLPLVEAPQRRGLDPHRGPPVGEHHDVRSLVGEVLVDDELVGVVHGGKARGRGPVDPGEVVSGYVTPRAGDVGAGAATEAADAAEGEAEHTPARDEREDAGCHR
jgi:hypothetical protein